MNSMSPSNEVVHLHDAELNSFSEVYLKVRRFEGRIYSDEMVKNLPFTEITHPYHKEWQLRLISGMRLHRYLVEKRQALRIMDIGCGNGWLANLIAQDPQINVTGIDVNQTELEQAARVFQDNKNISFFYANIMEDELPWQHFDIIVLCATIQYFPELPVLIDKLMNILNPSGEIHILDSPVYDHEEIAEARIRTTEYYKSIAHPEMDQFYFHHSRELFRQYKAEFLYDPKALLNKLNRKILSESDSPFPWIVIKK